MPTAIDAPPNTKGTVTGSALKLLPVQRLTIPTTQMNRPTKEKMQPLRSRELRIWRAVFCGLRMESASLSASMLLLASIALMMMLAFCFSFALENIETMRTIAIGMIAQTKIGTKILSISLLFLIVFNVVFETSRK